ncbi:hypothetical protein PVK06_012084 [Gossypium arboreum]|uniref:Putative plant transposon protein domain-containing protein n=1 Tax=Gossypium arboreum TaxID=29729 RepID=A0ABR0QB71_GOSAR|nr:hypothetical protein PVK06_012084 [Gossypium arboreum]
MARTRGLTKKANRPTEEHASFATAARESESHRPVLLPSTHSTTVHLDRMCLIHSIIKGRKIDVGAILHQEIAECAARQTRILVFPSLVMSLCRLKGIIPREDEEIMENKGPINEACFDRMSRGMETPILKEAGTTRQRRAKPKPTVKEQPCIQRHPYGAR